MDGLSVSFEWGVSTTYGDPHLKTRVRKQCLLNCHGRHKLNADTYVSLHKPPDGGGLRYRVRELPQSSACSVCGNVVMTLSSVQDYVRLQARDWAENEADPTIHQLAADTYYEGALREWLHMLAAQKRVLWSVIYSLDGVDLLELFHQDAGCKLDALADVLSGKWEDVVLPLADRIPLVTEDQVEFDEWPAPFKNHPIWRSMLHNDFDQATRKRHIRRFHDMWMAWSKIRFLRVQTGRVFVNRAPLWVRCEGLAMSVEEATYLLEQLVGREFFFWRNNKLYSYTIRVETSLDGDYYKMHTRQVPQA